MLTKLMPHLFTWAEIHGASLNQGYNWNSFLVQDESRNIRALIDPLPLSASEIQQIDELGGPTHLMLTCAYHERNLTEFKRRWDCEVLLHENQVHEVEFAFNDTFADRDVLWNLVEVVRVPNVRHREEVCFYLKPHGGVLIMGDLLSGGRKDSGIPDGKLDLTRLNIWWISTKHAYPSECCYISSLILYASVTECQLFVVLRRF